MTKKKRNGSSKTNQRIMREQRRAILEVMAGLVAGLRAEADEAQAKSVTEAMTHGSVEAPESVRWQLRVVAVQMAADAIEARAAKLRKTWA